MKTVNPLLKITNDFSLSEVLTFKVGGRCKYFIEVENIDQLENALLFSKQQYIPYLILGGGSNLLVSDSGFEGIVIKIKFDRVDILNGNIHCMSGVTISKLVDVAVEAELSGLEWAGGLPGTIGGGVRGNAGAFNGCTANLVDEISFMSTDGKIETINNAECKFGYRESIFKNNNNIIISVKLNLSPGKKENISKLTLKRINYRKEHHPLEYPNAGSVFKNIDNPDLVQKCIEVDPEIKKHIHLWGGKKVSAGFLIERCGLKGKIIGQAQVSEKHANFIINKNNAKANDILELINLIKATVMKNYDLMLEQEIQLIGF